MFTDENRERLFFILSLSLITACVIVEVISLSGVYAGCGYAVAVMLTLYARSKLNTFIAVAASTVAILFSVLYLHNDESFYIVTVNHLFSLLGVLVTMFFVLYVKGLQGRAEEDNKQVGALFSHATEGIILTGHDGNIVLVNPYAENLFGYFRDELIGRPIEILIPNDVKQRHPAYRDKFNQNPVSRTMGAGRDLFARRKDGSVFPVEISLSQYAIGKESFVIAFIIDITIRKQSEEALIKQTAEMERISTEIKKLNSVLEQKVEDRTMMLRETLAQLERSKDELASALAREKELSDLKSRFVSTVSHEFRTPLSTILSSAALVGRYKMQEEQDKRDRHVLRIKESVRHMNAMLEDLLSLGKLEEGLIVSKPETFELNKFLDDFVVEMGEIAKPGQNIICTKTYNGWLNTDKRLLKNILINLVSNAIKFSDEDGQIEIVCFKAENKVSISVKDHGMGISEDDQQHLFERFFRARNASNIQGTGLGLHIVLKYLELIGGEIYLESKLGQGSTFTISIHAI